MNARQSPPLAWAAIRAGSVETRYARAGVGLPVLLLAAPKGELPAADLFTALAGECRVFAPLHPQADGGECPTTPAWLRDLVDGLGLERPAVIAAPPYAELARDFTINDIDRVGGLILLEEDSTPPQGSGDNGWRVERGQLPGAGRPVLLLAVRSSAGRDWDAVAREVVQFIGEAASAPA